MCAKTIANPGAESTTERRTTSPPARWLGHFGSNGATWGALFGSLALALLYGHLTVTHMTAGIAGGAFNGYENLWNDYWLRTAFFHLHQNPFFTSYLEYPTGVSLRFHTLTLLGGLIALPFWPLIGPIATMNLKLLLAMVGGTFFAYLLLCDLTKSPLAAFGGAVVYCNANPFMIQYYISAEENYLMGTALLPLYVFFLLRAADRAHWRRDAIAATLVLFALCLTDWQYTLFAVLLTVFYFIFITTVSRSLKTTLHLLVRFAVIGGIWATIIFVPLVLPMIQEARSSPWLAVGDEAFMFSRSVTHLFAVGTDNPGYLVLAVTLIGLFLILRRAAAGYERQMVLFWACVAIFSVVISLGPRLEVRPFAPTRIPLPAALLYKLPVLNVGRKPHEFYASLAMLAFGVLFAFALRACIPSVRRFIAHRVAARPRLGGIERMSAPSLVVILLATTVAPFFVQASTTATIDPLDVPSFYRDVLAKDPEQYAILELPIFAGKRGLYPGTYQAFQLVHGKPRFGASISRDHNHLDPNLFATHATFIRDAYWMTERRRPPPYSADPGGDILPTPAAPQYGVPLLNYYHVRYIVLYLDALGDAAPHTTNNVRAWVRKMIGAVEPVYADDLFEAYRVPAAPSAPVFFDIGNAGWWPAELGADGVPHRWADSRASGAEFLAYNLTDRPRPVKLTFTAFANRTDRSLAVAINGQPLGRMPLTGNVQQPESVVMTLPPGMSTVTLSSPEPPLSVSASGGANADPRLLGFSIKSVQWEMLAGAP